MPSLRLSYFHLEKNNSESKYHIHNCCFLKGKGKLSIIAKEKPELFDWWIDKEKTSTFKKEITYQQIKDKSQSQLGLWDNDPSFECFCNID